MRQLSDLALLPLAILAGVVLGLAIVVTVYYVCIRELVRAVRWLVGRKR